MARLNAISRFWARMKSFFSGREDSAQPEEHAASVIRKGNHRPSSETAPFSSMLDTSFRYTYSSDFIAQANALTLEERHSSQDMPACLVHERPDIEFRDGTHTDLSTLINAFTPLQRSPEPSTVTGLKQERIRQIEAKRSDYSNKLDEVQAMIGRHDFDAATRINNTLLKRIEETPEFSDIRQQALSNVSHIASEEEAWNESERIRIEREQAERRRLQEEQIRAQQKQDLCEAINAFMEATDNSQWNECEQMRETLEKAVTFFQDNEVRDQYKGALCYFSDKYGQYLAEQRRREELRRTEEDARRRQREEARLRKQTEDTRQAIFMMKNAAQEGRWSDYAICKQSVNEEIIRTNDTLRELYADAVATYDSHQAQVAAEREQKERADLERRRENERAQREQMAAQREMQEKARLERIKDSYIRTPVAGGPECISLHKYLPKNKYGDYISAADDRIRRTIYDFKDGRSMQSRVEFCSDLSECLKSIYGDSIGGYWFCPAQASTPDKADRRYRTFCDMLSTTCGIQNGFHLIRVIGEKASAHYGGGARGDISNLEVSDDVYGKNIILFDDVLTSGSTMRNLRAELLRKGASSVDCFSFGKTV